MSSTAMKNIHIWIALLACTLVLAACSDKKAGKDDHAHTAADAKGESTVTDEDKTGFDLTLSEAETAADNLVRPRTVEGTPLSEAETKRLLSRLPALPAEDTAETEFAFREGSKPAPRTGETVKTAFPPDRARQAPDASKTAKTGPLEVLRYSPEGDVELAPKVSITFSKPMVAVTGQKDAAKTVPATIKPQHSEDEIAGGWRWIGTRTALFEPKDERFSMATDYKVAVPSSLASATGDKLDKAASFSFSTPPVQISRAYPTQGPQVRQPVMFMEFNQRIDPKTLVDFIDVESGGKTFEVARATEAQIGSDDTVKRLIDRARPGQFIAFRTAEPLPAAATISVSLTKGTPSAEGPKRTQAEQSHSFRTFDPLSVRRHSCTEERKCDPMRGWRIDFNNVLDEKSFSADMIHVEPELPQMEVRASYSRIQIDGQTKPRTTYKVTVDASLEDIHGQPLGEDTTIEMHVGPAAPQLHSSAGLMSVLDPALDGHFPVSSINHQTLSVRAYEVSPNHWDDYLAFVDDYGRSSTATPPGKKVIDNKIDIDAEDDTLTETLVDLNKTLGDDGHGQLLLMIGAIPSPGFSSRDNEIDPVRSKIVTWVQSTDIALDGFVSQNELLAWTSALSDGEPLDDVEVSLLGGEANESDASGLTTLDLPDASSTKRLAHGDVLLAKKGSDLAILPEHVSRWGRGESRWRQHDKSPRILWHVLDDRGMYKPGETVHLKGWLRAVQSTREDRLIQSGSDQIEYTVVGPRRNKLATGKVDVNRAGGFDFEIDLPASVNLGRARVELTTGGQGQKAATTSHSFQIQEFRRPEFEVGVSAPAGPHVVGQSATVTVDADYYAGGGLAGAPVDWSVQTREGNYTPPNRDDYIFGRWSPWWLPGHGSESNSESFNGHTDAAGDHHLKLDFNAANPPLPTVIEPGASVTDVNRQTWSSSATMLVHPAKVYVGIRSDKNFVAKDAPIEIEAIVTDIDGNLAADRPIEMTAARIDWTYKNGEYQQVEADKKTCQFTSGDAAETCLFEPDRGGSWRITAITRDERGRPSMSQMRVWVAGGQTPPNRRAEQQDVELIPDKETYQAGDTAKLLVQAPFAGAQGLITVRQNGVVSEEPFEVDGQSHTLEVPITEADYPNVHVQVDLVGDDVRRTKAGEPRPKAGKRPAFATGNISLKVPARSRVLSVAVSPDQKELAPGTKTSIDVEVTNADGEPAEDAEVALIAVDEAILALSDYELRDPIDSFYQTQPPGVQNHYLRQHLLLASVEEALVAQEAQFGAASRGAPMEQMMVQAPPAASAGAEITKARARREKPAGDGKAIALRKDFGALALLAPEVRTDADGKATVDLTLPDNLTRYRLMAVAVHGDDQFGTGESTLTAKLPLMVRPSPPRFLNWGDRMAMPVVIQNQTDEAQQVSVAVRAANLRFGGQPGKSFEVPARDRVEVRFKAVTEEAGEAIVQVAASTGNWSDAAQNKLPVWTPATTEAFATYGTIDGSGAQTSNQASLTQPVQPPSDAIEQFGGLEITTSSTALQELTDAVIYLFEYPYNCSEQLASRVMGIAALKDVLAAFDAPNQENGGLPDKEQLVDAVERDIKKLGQLQRSDGGFHLWSTRDNIYFPFVSIHVTHGLQRAKMKGFTVPGTMLKEAKKHLTNIEAHIPSTYPEVVKNSVRAYAYYVLDLMGAPQAHVQALALAKKGVARNDLNDALSLEAIGWITSTLADEKGAKPQLSKLQRHVQNQVSETAATAQFTTSYGGQEHLLMHSSRRTDAIVLDSIMATEPNSDLIAKVVRGLLDHRTQGRWLNTQENVFILLALDRYFQTYEKQTPNFVARMWLGDGYVGEHAFKGRSTDRKHVDIPMKTLVEDAGETTDLVVQKDGKGRLYYRIGMRYAPESLELDAADHGFAVERTYEGVDNPGDVTQKHDGTWHIKPGARVRVMLTMVAPARRYHVALVDPLPAGLEPINSELAVSEFVPDQDDANGRNAGYWWWLRPWYSHQNLRDERAEAFAPQVWAGVHEYSYVARATTPGEFVAPPTKAEEMYHPETFGRTGTDRVIIK
jgi:uncharacterized protein YfaS (alpha-2-macroglobulin family)